MNYTWRDGLSNVKSKGEAEAVLGEKYLTLLVNFGEPLLLAYVDILEVLDHDYQVDLLLGSRQELNLSGLGYQYEDFVFQLCKLRNELLLKYLLMEEPRAQASFEAHFHWFNAGGKLNQTGDCEVRLYETALVVLPRKGEPVRVPYCYISQINKADYKLEVASEFGERFVFSMLGEKFDPLAKGLSDAFNRMLLRSQETVKELVPEADPAAVRKLAALLKDGRAAKKRDIDVVSSDFWRRLTKSIKEADMGAEFDFLDSMALRDQVCVGVKRGLMGSLTGSYFWLLFPLCDSKTGKLSNAVALETFSASKDTAQNQEDEASGEAGSGEDAAEQGAAGGDVSASGRATYFFRIRSRQSGAPVQEAEANRELEAFIGNVNRCMVDINFRRAPIYLTDEALDSSKYAQYRYAVAKMPSLKLLRALFIGRVVHSSFDQWRSDVASLLAFNNKSKVDNEKWLRGVE